MARPRCQSWRQRQGTFHVQVPKLPGDQALTVKNFPRRGQSCEVRSHPSASMQWNQNDIATNKQGQPETTTVSLTVSRYMAGGTSIRSSWLSQPCAGGRSIPSSRHLEFDAFQFVHKWLLEESLMVGWTFPEELELNRLFRFLVEHRDKIRCSSCRQAATTIQKWQRLVSGIRHAAVHRLLQDRESLLRMTRVAIGFSLCIGGLSSVEKLRRLLKFLEDRLPNSERRRTQSRAPSFLAKSAPRRSERPISVAAETHPEAKHTQKQAP
ncbi:unnamed protein product [Penicillium nalgiovense]|nr:unnamed protein product [Penicillium nalgiovense]